MSLLPEQLDAGRLQNRRTDRNNLNEVVGSTKVLESLEQSGNDSATREQNLSHSSLYARPDDFQPSLEVWQRLRQHLKLLACLLKQEGIAQVKVNSQRALYLRYQELVESDIANLTFLLSARDTVTNGSHPLLADAGSQFTLDKARLFEQAKLLHDAESNLSGIKHRMTEIEKKMESDFNLIFTAGGARTSYELVDLWKTSNDDAELPTTVSEYFHKMQEIAVLEDRLVDLAVENEERPCRSSEECGLEGLNDLRRAALEAQIESIRGESAHLKERCFAQGRNPETYRYRRSSSCSASDLSFIDCDSVVTYDEELDAIRIA